MLHLSEARGRILKFYSSQFSNTTLHFYCNNVYTVEGLSWFPVSGTWEDGELESSHPSQPITQIQFSTFDFLPFLFFSRLCFFFFRSRYRPLQWSLVIIG